MSQTRSRLLAEMGIKPLWRLRDVESATEMVPVEAIAATAPQPAVMQQAVREERTVHVQERPAQRVAPPMPAMQPAAPAVQPVAAPVQARIHDTNDTRDWPELEAAVRDCQACGLCKQRKQAVFGVGDQQADWLFVGEGPGAEEDERGEPFVGQAGKLLDAMLAAISLKRGEDVYIANTVKCRPPGNRTPEAPEIAACHPFLARQVALIQPKLIIALGRPAAQTLLNAEVKISASRGKLFAYQGIPVIVTYHPAYLLRNLTDKARAWEDLCFAQDTMARLKAAAMGTASA